MKMKSRMPKLTEVYHKMLKESESMQARPIPELVREIESNLEEEETNWEDSMSSPENLSPGNVAVYVVNDNAGYITLTKENMLRLHSLGYVSHADVIFHPENWDPTDDLDAENVVHGHDGVVKAKNAKAIAWGKSKHLF